MAKALFATAILCLLAPTNVLAYGGGLDASGCHHDRKAGDYHCHRGGSSGSPPQPQSTPAATKPGNSKVIEGVATVVDGDTLEVHGKRIRMHGVDAPESAQLCADTSGKSYRCGQKTAMALADEIGRRSVRCEGKDTDRYGRTVAVCSVGGMNLNSWLVERGYAVAYQRYSTDYLAAEAKARAAKIGIWQGAFDMPWDWRAAKRGR